MFKNMKLKTILLSGYFKGALLLVFGIILGKLFFGGHGHNENINSITETVEKTIWTCSMHPQIRMEEKGLCPLCGMDLIPLSSGSSGTDENAIVMTEEAISLAGVQTMSVSKQQPVKEVRLYGKIQADENTLQKVTSHFSGRIEKLYFNYTGEKISKGQTISEIYSPELVTAQQELLEAVKIKNSQPGIYQAARQKLLLLKMTEKQIEEIIDEGAVKTILKAGSDISGTIISRNVSQGNYVQAGTTLYELADLSKVWVVFEAYESDLPWIKTGSEITFSLIALPGKLFKGKIDFIEPVLDAKTRIVKARVEMKNEDGGFKPGMLVTGIVKASLPSNGKSIVVPSSAVLWTGTRSLVYVRLPDSEEPAFVKRDVILGNQLHDSYEILHGLNEGEEIVVNGTFNVDAAAQLAGKSSMMNTDGANTNIDVNNLATEKFRVEGVCVMCKERIESAVTKTQGVVSASWNVKTKMLDVSFDRNIISLDAIKKNIAIAGHDNGDYKASDDVYDNLHECCKYRQ